MPHFFQNTSLSGVNHFLDFVKDNLVTEGWTAYHLNTTTGSPSEDRLNYSYVFTAPGKTGTVGDLPANHGFYMGWAQQGGNSHINFGVFSGYKRVPTGSISKTSNTVTVNATNHGLRVGDVLIVLGTGNNDFHAGWISDDGPLTVATVPDVNTFTYSDTVTPSTISPTTFENIFAIYNAGGSFTAREFAPMYTIGDFDGQIGGSFDPAMNAFCFADEYRVCGAIQVAEIYRPFYIGITGRDHVPPTWRDCGALTTNVTGTGSPQVIQLDRSCPNMNIGQPIWFIPTNDSNGQKNNDRNHVSRGGPAGAEVTASAKPSASRVEVTLRSGDAYPPGTIVGFDPTPLVLLGKSTTLQTDINDSEAMMPIFTNGTVLTTNSSTGSYEDDRSDFNLFNPSSYGTTIDNELAPYGPGLYQGFDLMVGRNTSFNGTKRGIRYPLPGFVAFAKGDQANGDLMVVGRNIAANRWKVFTTLEVTDNNGFWIVGIGPGAS